jgi:hypothetical protein
VSSLWTPSGEHRVPPQDEPGGAAPPDEVGGAPERTYPSPEEEREIKEQLAELSKRVAAAPPEEIVANHAYGLFELAAIHLSHRPPNVEAARLAIDGLGLLVDGLGERLGAHAPSLREALAQIRLAYVQILNAAPSGDGVEPSARIEAEHAADADGVAHEGAEAEHEGAEAEHEGAEAEHAAGTGAQAGAEAEDEAEAEAEAEETGD